MCKHALDCYYVIHDIYSIAYHLMAFKPPLKSNEKACFYQGGAGNIEAIYSSALATNALTALVIICHPHPLHGGTMHNKVVTTLAKAFNEQGMDALRFNFRGVGESEGLHDKGKGEAYDLAQLLNTEQARLPQRPIWLAGFSFGAFVSFKVATSGADIAGLVSVAPAISASPYVFEAPIECPWGLFVPLADEVVSADETLSFVKPLEKKPNFKLYTFDACSHFFHGQLMTLKTSIQTFLTCTQA